jgi:hypothetical protein
MKSADFYIVVVVNVYECYRLQKEHFTKRAPWNLFWETDYLKPGAEHASVIWRKDSDHTTHLKVSVHVLCTLWTVSLCTQKHSSTDGHHLYLSTQLRWPVQKIWQRQIAFPYNPPNKSHYPEMRKPEFWQTGQVCEFRLWQVPERKRLKRTIVYRRLSSTDSLW